MMRFLLAPLFLAALVSARSASSNVRCDNRLCYCVGNDGQNLGHPTPVGSSVEKTCDCAVAAYEYSKTGLIGLTFSCDVHGNYKAVQCVGSVCHCSSSSGKNIGYESPIGQSSQKNCQCALDKHEYQQTGMLGKTFSCDELGNYAPVNCLGSVCTCTSADGKNLGYESAISQVSTKNCQCAVDKHEYQKKGLVGKTFSCDEHGNYAAVNCLGSVCTCTTSEGKNIGYETPIHQASQKTCQCALDKHEYQEKGLVGKTFSCDEHGNYKAVNCLGSVCHCMTPSGKNIGYSTPIHQVAQKTCQCALDKHNYEQSGMLGQSFSCDQHGNYEPLRCVGSVCFCVDAYGEQTSISTAPIGQHDELNC